MEHDASYTLLFSHARMVKDLLHGCVHEAWVREVDYSTLEREGLIRARQLPVAGRLPPVIPIVLYNGRGR